MLLFPLKQMRSAVLGTTSIRPHLHSRKFPGIARRRRCSVTFFKMSIILGRPSGPYLTLSQVITEIQTDMTPDHETPLSTLFLVITVAYN
jgi:hypothetical protein